MAKKVSENEILNMSLDWAYDMSNGLPYSGAAVQKFIKDKFNTKAGIFYNDTTNNRYLVFADEETRDAYLQDTSQTNLIIGAFDAPFNYTAEIELISNPYQAISLGSTGNYIEFDFDIKNKNGISTGDNITCTFTITKGSLKKIVTQKYRAGVRAKFNVDEYLSEGTNRITIGIIGQQTLAATTIGVTYLVVDLLFEDSMNISTVYDLAKGNQSLQVPFTITGAGTKIVEWFIDGVAQEYDKNVDEIVDVTSARTKYIQLSDLARGAHSLDVRAYVKLDETNFYSKVFHREFIIENSGIDDKSPIIVLSYIKDNMDDTTIELEQYIPYDLTFSVYDPFSPQSIPVEIFFNDEVIATLNVKNGTVNKYPIVPVKTGEGIIKILTSGIETSISVDVAKNKMGLQELMSDLELAFTAVGMSNNQGSKYFWQGNGITATLNGFNFTDTSGWVNDRLIMLNGASIEFDYAPMAKGTTEYGKTLEFELASSNVTNDTAVLCDMVADNGSGIIITASEAKIISRGGTVLSVKYKSDENTRISFVINKAENVTNKRLVFVYVDGVLSGAANFASTDDFVSDVNMKFAASAQSEILLKQIRIYNTALTSDQILNNFILYRDTVNEMMTVYDRNNVYEEGSSSLSPDILQGQLPVMIVTGDIPALENTTNKDTQITVDIDYYNLQDPSRSFTMKDAAMRPQGTSSMLYPKKNFRIYTQKNTNTVLTVDGKVVEDKLYAFKAGAQPVNCWCLKADFAESSGTHNTGIARLWNDLLMNTAIDGEYVFRTEAQKKALENNYEYDVRTTIDGFPILMFYRLNEDSDLIFIGKYNFNNDKSTESVFGFTGIPGFDNSKMQCWEILNNGDSLALFTEVSDFDTRWAEAFESRYPDTKTPNTSYLKAFSQWLNGVKNDPVSFALQKRDHLNLYLIAAYYVYLMRFGAVDQTVKNAMLTSEDGEHFYFINYDNDTINGLRNNGVLVFDPTIDRQSLDPQANEADGVYAYAGHDSVLWNLLEGDEEFMDLVKVVDNALYTSGLRYDNVIRYFDDDQCSKWNERIYNQDAQYKYVGPYTNEGTNNLLMLQGNRKSHRRWWLSKRFSLYDSKFISGDFKSKVFEFKVTNNTEGGWQFDIKAGTEMDYGYGVYNPIETGIHLQEGESHSFTMNQTLNIGDPVRIYSAYNLMGVDLSDILPRLSNVELKYVYDETLGTKLKELVLGDGIKTNQTLTSISSLSKAKRLEYLDIRGCEGIKSIDLSELTNLKTFLANGSGLTSVNIAKGANVSTLTLPSTLQTLRLEQLTDLTQNGFTLEEGGKNIIALEIINCPQLSKDMNFFILWLANKNTPDIDTTLCVDNIDWNNVAPETFSQFCQAVQRGVNLTLKGRVKLTASSQEIIDEITAAFGSLVFKPTSDLYINAPDAIYLAGPDEILEGESAQFTAAVFTENYGTVTYSIYSGSRSGVTLNPNTGYLTSTENGYSDSTITIRARHKPTVGSTVYVDKSFIIKKRIYPNPVILGSNKLNNEQEIYTWTTSTTNVTGDYRVEWELTGDITAYAVIELQNKEKCVIKKIKEATTEVTGTLLIKIIKNVDNAQVYSSSISLVALNPDILVTTTSNPTLMKCMYDAGLAANVDYMTKTEASYITDIDIQPGTSASTSIFVKYGKYIETFEEFEYFTSLKTIPTYTFGLMRYLTRIKIPALVETLCSYCFQLCNSLLSITIPSSVTTIETNAFSSCTELTAIYGASGVTHIDRSAFGNVKKVSHIDASSTFGIFVYDLISTTISNISYINAFLYGERTFTIPIAYAQYFDNKAKTKTVYLTNTGKAENITDLLKFSYYDIEIRSNINDAKFNLTYKSSISGEEVTVEKNVGTYIIDVPYDHTLTIKGIYEGYSANEITLTLRSQYDRYIKFDVEFFEAATVGIAHKDGTFYTTEQWTAGGYSNDDAEGVCMMRAKSGGLVIAKEDASSSTLIWGGYQKTIPNIGTTNSTSEAVQDFDGAGNTPKIIEYLAGTNDGYSDGAPAAEACTAYTFPSGTKGYLPALGEWKIAHKNATAVISAMSLIGGTAIKDGYYWSSTQYNSNSSWQLYWNNGGFGNYSKTNYCYVRAFSAFYLLITSTISTQFTVSYTDNYGNAVTQKVGVGRMYLNVKNGTQVTVTPDAVGTITAEPQTFTWSGFSHECHFVFAKDAGVYIQHINGSLYTESEWTAGGYANSDANGVAVVSFDTLFVIAKEDASSSELRWGGYDKTISGIVTSGLKAVAILDMDGIGNTQKIIEQCAGHTGNNVTGAPVAEACAAYTFPSGKKGYLPALGEWQAAYNNKAAVDSAMTLIGGTAINIDFYTDYWSSTQYDNYHSWSVKWGGGKIGNTTKSNTGCARAFTTL